MSIVDVHGMVSICKYLPSSWFCGGGGTDYILLRAI
jgi:hypothetical protein